MSCLVLAVYLILLAISINSHELWGDELHGWNLAKASNSYSDLIHNIRYEGHPPLWHSLAWILSKFTHNIVYVQCLQYFLAAWVAVVVLLYSPFPPLARFLIPFGYYFAFEYGVFSRNYAVGVLLVFYICLLLKPGMKQRSTLLYYTLLFLLSNTHLIAALLAASLHLYFLLDRHENVATKGNILFHTITGIVIMLPTLYFIFPPGDSGLNMHFWVHRWNGSLLADIATAPVKAYMPIPAWWHYHFWNTEFLVQGQYKLPFLKPFIYLTGVFFIGLASFILKENKKALALFLLNVLLTVMVGILFPLTSMRYVGFLWIGFLVACWLHLNYQPFNLKSSYLLYVLLGLQLPGSIIALSRDICYPFSNARKVRDLIKAVPSGNSVVADYWCINNVAAYIDRPFYCLQLNQEISYILWDKRMAAAMSMPFPYTQRLSRLFNEKKIREVYLISTNSPKNMAAIEAKIFTDYHVTLAKAEEGAIEEYSNVYLYKVESRQ